MQMWDTLLQNDELYPLTNLKTLLDLEQNERKGSVLDVGFGTFLNPSLDVRAIHDALDQSQQFLVVSKVLFTMMLQWGGEEVGHLDVRPSDL